MKALLVLFLVLSVVMVSAEGGAENLTIKQKKELSSLSYIFSPKTDEDWMKIELNIILERNNNKLKYFRGKGISEEEIGILKLNYLIFSLDIESCLQSFNKDCYDTIKNFISSIENKK